jgi:hypothetical protein
VAESLIKKPLTRASSGRSTRDYPFMISDHKHNYNYSIAMHPNRKGDRVVRRGRPTVVSLPREYIASKIKTLWVKIQRHISRDPKTSKSKRNFLPFIKSKQQSRGYSKEWRMNVTRVHRKAANLGDEKGKS